ncbi:MAG: 3-isopropylmalate dehydrogenase [Bacteroidales bacterium]|nr:3-isopropylmalate dehydrogenase [Bacteroidales bacterium]
MKFKIAKLPGDGIGPEVVEQAVKAIDAVCERFGHSVEYRFAKAGACAIDEFGSAYPEQTHNICMESDAVLFGAVGDPRYDNDPTSKVRPEQGLLAMRKQLGLYANLRPMETFPSLLDKSPLKKELVSGAEFLCVRELTGGMYFGEKGRLDGGDTAYDTNIYHRYEVERILALAYECARKRRNHLTVVDKANVLESSRLWRQIAQEMAPKYPDVTTDYMYVDNAAMRMISEPRFFDVLVTENTFGDILTDEASCISGSMGLLASASVGEHTSVYEPIHGSYPQAAGKNIANPLATILSAAMMFESSFNLPEEAKAIREAVSASISENYVTVDLNAENPRSTSEVGDWVAERIRKQ